MKKSLTFVLMQGKSKILNAEYPENILTLLWKSGWNIVV